VRRFFKLSGGGNDFIAFVEPEAAPEPAEIRGLCTRGLSLGADGIFILRRAQDGMRIDHWNSDGRPADLCLNGTRCAAQLAFHLGWADEVLELLTSAGTIAARSAGENRIVLEVPIPGDKPNPSEIDVNGDLYRGWQIRIGVPHFVLPWPEDLAGAPVTELGPRLRHAPLLGSEGANVDFVSFPGPHRLEIRTYERGVEAETLACGTGILASTEVGLELGALELPVEALTAGGYLFEVGGGAGTEPPLLRTLAGDARLLAEGQLLTTADRLPDPPAWH
jgi:diaminopimelate epimerase